MTALRFGDEIGHGTPPESGADDSIRKAWAEGPLPFGAFFSLPSSFLRGTATAGGIGLIGTFGNFGSFLGPVLIGALVQGSGDYASGFAAVALGFVLAALIVLAVGRAMAPRPVLVEPRAGAAE